MQEGGLDLPGCELNAAGIVLILGLLAAQPEWNLPPPHPLPNRIHPPRGDKRIRTLQKPDTVIK